MKIYIIVHTNEIAVAIHTDRDFLIVYYRNWIELLENVEFRESHHIKVSNKRRTKD